MNPPNERTVWEENSPDSLLDITVRFLLQHPQIYCVRKLRRPTQKQPQNSSSMCGKRSLKQLQQQPSTTVKLNAATNQNPKLPFAKARNQRHRRKTGVNNTSSNRQQHNGLNLDDSGEYDGDDESEGEDAEGASTARSVAASTAVSVAFAAEAASTGVNVASTGVNVILSNGDSEIVDGAVGGGPVEDACDDSEMGAAGGGERGQTTNWYRPLTSKDRRGLMSSKIVSGIDPALLEQSEKILFALDYDDGDGEDGKVDPEDDDEVDYDEDDDFDEFHNRKLITLLPDLYLPADICDKIFKMIVEEGLDIDDHIAGVFSDTTRSRLRSVNVRDCSLTDVGLTCLLRHQLRDLDIHNCEGLSSKALEIINMFSDNLVNLNVGSSTHILPDKVVPKIEIEMKKMMALTLKRQKRDEHWKALTPGRTERREIDEDRNRHIDGPNHEVIRSPPDDEDGEGQLWGRSRNEMMSDTDSLDEYEYIREEGKYDIRGYILKAPVLQRLAVKDLHIQRGGVYMDLLLRPLTKLTHLDLTGLSHNSGLKRMEFLLHLPQLLSLNLHRIEGVEAAVDTICQLKRLRHLDISHYDETAGRYHEPNRVLAKIVTSLEHLRSLDISGTNLAGRGSYDQDGELFKSKEEEADRNNSSADSVNCDIPGLVSRVGRPLDFLGLYKCHHDAAFRAKIPAKRIAGDANEKQIITAGQQFLDRPLVLGSVLNELFHIFRYEEFEDVKSALDVILVAMDRHPREKVIQIPGSASLYYIVKIENRRTINVKMKRKILSTLLNGMLANRNDAVMMRNGCLTLCNFSIPQDVFFDSERLVRILLYTVSEHTSEESSFVQRAGIYLLNSLACQVDGEQKLLVGNLGAIERMLTLIRDRVARGVCDDVMETAWSCMWNVTDETPINCKRFLDGDGMDLFLRCKTEFPNKQDLLRNMVGLLGNVAEVPNLRSHLMNADFVAEFHFLLNSTSDGIEVSYNAAGVLAHMLADGAGAWTIREPKREDVLDRMTEAIERWDLNTKRNINYRSFEPILRLVRVHHTPQCQHWAIWALANLTNVEAEYCKLVEQEGGLPLLEELINRNNVDVEPPYPRVLELASQVRENVTRWKEKQDSSDGSEMSLDYDG